MMKRLEVARQWLFIGGPRHGDTTWVEYDARSVLVPVRNRYGRFDACIYQAETHRIPDVGDYQIGVCDPTDQQRQTVDALIISTHLQPFRGPDSCAKSEQKPRTHADKYGQNAQNKNAP